VQCGFLFTCQKYYRISSKIFISSTHTNSHEPPPVSSLFNEFFHLQPSSVFTSTR